MKTISLGRGDVVGTTALGKELGMSRVAAFKRIQNGSVKAIRIGNAYVIPATEVRRVYKLIYFKGKPRK